MAENQFTRLTKEPAVFLLIFISLLLIKLTFDKELGTEIITIYATMLLGDFILFGFNSEVRSVSGNSAQSLLYAGAGLLGLFVLYQVVQFFFRQSVLPVEASTQQLSQSIFQTVYQSTITFSGQQIDFSKFYYVKFYLFGFLIPIMETRAIGRIYGAVANLTNININNLRSLKNWALISLVSILFMYFHLKVRGANNNLDLAMTFLFAVVSLVLVSKFRELESANYLHIGWNSLALALGK